MQPSHKPIATTTKKLFSRTTTVNTLIQAPANVIWSLLTDVEHYPTWNSTLISIEGSIQPGGSIKLKSKLDPNRTFTLKIKDFQEPTRLIWGDATGTRVYTLENTGASGTRFTMTETIGGPLFPLFASQIPSFDASFEQFTRDLKQTAEAGNTPEGS
jgi:uncharacterized protein YndB with AHSA1/START domain